MFCVDDSTAQAIQRAYEEGGELSAAVELRRHFRGIVDIATARRCARIIVGWTPPPPLTASKELEAGTERRGTKRDRRRPGRSRGRAR